MSVTAAASSRPTVTAKVASRPTVGDWSVPFFTEAVVWLNVAGISSAWTPSSGIANSGTGGTAYDAAKDVAGAKGKQVVANGDISIVNAATGRGVQIGDADDRSRSAFIFPQAFMDLFGSGSSLMLTIDTTVNYQDSDPDSSIMYFDMYEGSNVIKFDDPEEPAQGLVVEYVGSNFPGGPGWAVACNDDTLPFGCPPFTDPNSLDYAETADDARVRLSFRFDRAGGDYQFWVDGAQYSEAAINDMTNFSVFDFGGGPTNMRTIAASLPLASLAGSATPIIGGAQLLHHIFVHQSGTAAFSNPAALHEALGV